MDVLNLGAGNLILAGAVNHDRTKHRPEIAVAHDLNVLPWPWKDESFDKVVAKAVFEHLDMDLVRTMEECWRILRPKGTIYLKLPFWKAEASYTDPTHRWRYNLSSLQIFDPETVFGRRYEFYTVRKWRIVRAPRLNRARTSIHAVLEVRKG